MTGTGAVGLSRDLIVASGKDTVTFLHGQLSQDVASMPEGAVRWAFHLTPQGRVIALVRLTRLVGDSVLIDTDAGSGDAVRANLARFRIRTACDLELLASVPTLRSPGVPGSSHPVPAAVEVVAGATVTVPSFPGVAWTDTIGDASGPIDADALADWRVGHRVPAAGAEIDERWLPPETGLLGIAVAFGKGCYVGQELVERIDARGRVNRILCTLTTSAEVAPSAEITRADTGAAVGTVTTVAGTRSLGYLRVDAIGADLRCGAASVAASEARPPS
jgi:hypothetical protein